ncbi:DUF2628 domain-containing protein [Bacillus cytotoxicus]|uniref:DUF2628 domain-containing protein n=1 Tax=Bacillus cereus group sp. BfR-BA-01492 TaxID=2920361 RepID=UPI001F59306E|nr:DUF2628 domain-containing protein [Bacillus cereus group sp. BfR-BA-01492]EMA6343131.1 DUF2628 domain-containing protein [Bacillus cytotoxicus]EMA6345273.1 DUF2628 domain-containing protein [Bacillus cytotoxicus]
MERGIVLQCINCGNPCADNQWNCNDCQRILHNESNGGISPLETAIEQFVGVHYPYYRKKWDQENKRIARWSWNGWAAIFTVGWFGYRKYYWPAFLFVISLVACDAFSYYMGFNVALPIINIVPLTFLLLIFMMIGVGLFANGLYYRFAERKIYRIKAKEIKDKAIESYLIRDSGGTSKIGAVMVTVLTAASIFLSHFFFPTDQDVIRKVRTSSLYEYPFFTIGESFDLYFQQSQWDYYRGTDGLELVEFRGYTQDMPRRKIMIQFVVDYQLHEVEPYSLSINGQPQGEKEFLKMMEDVFQIQNPFELDDELQWDDSKKIL